MERTRNYIPTLDGWRALSIAAVMFSHMPFVRSHWLLGLQTRGGLGVSVFFVISGYLICSRLMQEEQQFGSVSLRRFYIRRIFRIQPAALVFLATLVMLYAVHLIPLNVQAWRWALLAVRNYYPQALTESPGVAYTNHFWSLAVEEHFYLVIPFLIVFLPKQARILWLSLIFVATFAYARYCWYRGWPGLHTGPAFEQLMLPSLLAVLLFERPFLKKYVTRKTVLAAIVVLGLGISSRHLHGAATDPMIHMLLAVCVIGSSLLPSSWPSRFLELSILRFLDRISYSLYLWQQLFCIRANLSGAGPLFRHLQAPPLNILCALLCALGSYYFIERPFIHVGHQLASRATAPTDLI